MQTAFNVFLIAIVVLYGLGFISYIFAPPTVQFWIMAGIFAFAFFIRPAVSIALWLIRGINRW